MLEKVTKTRIQSELHRGLRDGEWVWTVESGSCLKSAALCRGQLVPASSGICVAEDEWVGGGCGLEASDGCLVGVRLAGSQSVHSWSRQFQPLEQVHLALAVTVQF